MSFVAACRDQTGHLRLLGPQADDALSYSRATTARTSNRRNTQTSSPV